MSCELRISGKNFNVDAFVDQTQMSAFRKAYKGGLRGGLPNRKNEFSSASITASNADFDDFKGQLSETIDFLTEHKDQLQAIRSTPDIEYAIIDFGITSAINKEKLMQTFVLGKNLIKLCAELDIEIVLSLYKEDMQQILEKRYREKKSKTS